MSTTSKPSRRTKSGSAKKAPGKATSAILTEKLDHAMSGKDEIRLGEAGTFVKINGYYYVHEGLQKILTRNLVKGVNTLLLGPTGIGKTELGHSIAKELGMDVHILDMGTMSDPIMSLIGTHVITVKEGETSSEFKKSRFSDIIQKPGLVILDELSRANLQSNNLLFPVLDFRKELPMEYCFEDNTPIQIHPDCRFIATANIGSEYSGTGKIDRALLDRFMLVQVDELPRAVAELILKNQVGLTATKASHVLDVYYNVKKLYKDLKVSFDLSFRHLKMIASMVNDGFTIYDSFHITAKGLAGNEGANHMVDILGTHGSYKK
jgi:MoxR-like ATPase